MTEEPRLVCAWCKHILNGDKTRGRQMSDDEYAEELSRKVSTSDPSRYSHGICRECMEEEKRKARLASGIRVCSKCDELKLPKDFYARKSICKSCLCKMRREERLARRGCLWRDLPS